MGNCLVTKLKATVDNESLVILGHFRINVFPTEVGSRILELAPISGKTLDVKANGGTFHVNGQSTELSEITISSGTELVLSNNEFTIDVSGKYGDLFALRQSDISKANNCYTVDVASLVKYNKLDYLIYSGAGRSELVYMQPSTVKQCGISNTELFVNIEQFVNADLSTLNLTNTQSIGSIVSLGKCLSLGRAYLENCSKLVGEINDLANALVANGKTSGSLVIFGPLTGCTDDGNAITLEYLASKGNGDYVALDFASGSYTKRYSD